MRGKNIVWLSLIMMLLSALVPMGANARVTNCMLRVTPKLVEGVPGEIIQPGMLPSFFKVVVTVEDVTNLYAYGFDVIYAPFQRTVAVSSVVESDFLKNGGETYFTYDDKAAEGILSIGVSLLGVPWVPPEEGGAYPQSTRDPVVLVTITFFVLEGGHSGIVLSDTALLTPVWNPVEQKWDVVNMPHQSRDGYYEGPKAELVKKELPLGHKRRVGQMQQFNSLVRNKYPVPLYVKVLFEMTRVEDAKHLTLGSGQETVGFGELPFWFIEPLQCDGYYLHWADGYFGISWNQEGANPYIDEIDYPDNYVWQSGSENDAAMSAAYTFPDIPPLQEGESISRVILEGYTNCENVNIDLDIYTCSPTIFDWLGSLWGTTTWAWHTPRWVGGAPANEMVPALGTEAGLNSVELILYHYAPGMEGKMMCDKLRFQVELTLARFVPEEPPVYIIEGGGPSPLPATFLDMEPGMIGPLSAEDVGTYLCTATLYYSYYGSWFNPGGSSSFAWRVTD